MRPGRLETRLAEARAVARMLPVLVRARPGSTWSLSRLLLERAERQPHDTALAYGDTRLSWREVDAAVNRSARALQQAGVAPGDTVALLMDNRPEYVVTATALSRLRAIGALINTHVAGKALAHALRVASASHVVVGSEHAEKLEAALPEVEGLDADRVFEQADPEEPGRAPRFASFDLLGAAQPSTAPAVSGASAVGSRAFYIYTSGTTGLPKAAIISSQRILAAAAMMGRGIFELAPGDVHYVTLPLYHSAGFFGGWCSALATGCCMAFRRRFSASRFWDDVRRFEATSFIYIGELCRYLLNVPETPEDGKGHRLRIAGGNGLRPDIWERFQERFAIPRVREYYGATEGTLPLVNYAGVPGMVGRLLPGNVIVRCDLETGELRRNEAGRCEAVGVGETGLLLGRIAGSANYDGYVDEAATRKKIVQGAFRPSDRYFDTGDLLTLHEDAWVSFADRVGDTFRWKGENVSTNEVAEILNGAPGVEETNVYGVRVPGSEGRAGMASVHVGEAFSTDAFGAFVAGNLPVYQRPYFLRVQRDIRITGTFKHQKVDYQREGYDPSKVSDPLYWLDGEKYVPLDAGTYEGIQSGRIPLR
ncbi:MAG: long-chain-acyl-CoA synthetase [Myxococcota bacterium]